jgi:uncharacterized protein (UPF0297 family)
LISSDQFLVIIGYVPSGLPATIPSWRDPKAALQCGFVAGRD